MTYILPIKAATANRSAELAGYLRWLAQRAETIVVDGSPAHIFAEHAAAWGMHVRHTAPHADLATPMGKVGGVLTGVRLASHERLIIADDDVRYDDVSMAQLACALDNYDVVRPQNYFEPLPWHARVDTGRMLLNRATGGDWPGTLGVRRAVLRATGGYDGSVMFENLELVRTVLAAGGNEQVLLGAYVLRHPSSTQHFWSQRVRQAYDEMARPGRLAVQLAVIPAIMHLIRKSRWQLLAAGIASIAAVAEFGRRRAGGAAVFPVSSSLLAPVWFAERAVCSWLALGAHFTLGGIPYRGAVLCQAATPIPVLEARHSGSYHRLQLHSNPSDRKPRRKPRHLSV
ncbi:MAG: glycosyltransferase [Gemmatimonadaceae bacterium]